MSRRRTARIIFGIGFVVLLLDGAAAIWLGQVSARPALIVVGVLMLVAAAALAAWYRRWMVALDAVDAARRDVQAEVARLRDAVSAARGGRPNPN